MKKVIKIFTIAFILFATIGIIVATKQTIEIKKEEERQKQERIKERQEKKQYEESLKKVTTWEIKYSVDENNEIISDFPATFPFMELNEYLMVADTLKFIPNNDSKESSTNDKITKIVASDHFKIINEDEVLVAEALSTHEAGDAIIKITTQSGATYEYLFAVTTNEYREALLPGYKEYSTVTFKDLNANDRNYHGKNVKIENAYAEYNDGQNQEMTFWSRFVYRNATLDPRYDFIIYAKYRDLDKYDKKKLLENFETGYTYDIFGEIQQYVNSDNYYILIHKIERK